MRVLRDVRILMCVMILSLGFGYVSEAQASVRFLGSAADAFGANDNKYDTGTGVVCTPPQVGVGTSWKNANGQQVYSSCKCPDTFKYNVQNCSYPNALSGTACQGNYDGCTCLATFNSSNCTSPKALGGDTCGGKYTTCTCPSDYDQTCTGSGQAGVLPACDGKYKSCGCDASYNQACTGAGESPAGTACGGKYQSCSCSSDYQYTCTNPGQVGVGAACNSKYTSCNCSGSYQSCSCGPAAGASTCTDSNATSFYTACAACCDDTCPAGYSKTNPGGSYISVLTECETYCFKSGVATTLPLCYVNGSTLQTLSYIDPDRKSQIWGIKTIGKCVELKGRFSATGANWVDIMQVAANAGVELPDVSDDFYSEYSQFNTTVATLKSNGVDAEDWSSGTYFWTKTANGSGQAFVRNAWANYAVFMTGEYITKPWTPTGYPPFQIRYVRAAN